MKSGFTDITDDGVVFVLGTNLTISFVFVILFSICTKWIDYKKGWRSATRTPLLTASDVLRDDDASSYDTPTSLISHFSEESDQVSFKKFIREHWSPVAWITKTYRMSSPEVFSLAGFEALAYLEFLKYLVRFFCIASIIVLCALLPLNLSGERRLSGFRSTTVDNLLYNSPKLWAHLGVMCILSVGAFIVVFNFQNWLSTARTQYMHRSQSDFRQTESKWKTAATKTTVLIEKFPRNFLDEEYLQQKLETLYVDRIAEVCIPLEIKELIQLEKERKRYEEMANELRSTDPIKSESYMRQADRCTRQIGVWKLDRHEGTGVAFVTFKTEEDHNKGLHSALSARLESNHWIMSHAPEPKAIQWDNLSFTTSQKFWRRFSFQILVIVIFFVFLVPALLLASVESLSEIPRWRSRVEILSLVYNWSAEYTGDMADDMMFAFVPVLILVIMSIVGTHIVLVTSKREGYTLRKKEQYANTRKIFMYLMFFSLIIPVAVLGTVRSLVVSETQNYDFIEALGHSFLPNSGAFFINYIITVALLQNSIELFSLPEIFHYYLSKRKYRKNQRFQYSKQYAWILVTVATILLFSTFVPLIVPAGAVLFGYRFLVDKHNLCFVHRRTTQTSGKLLNAGLRYFVAIIVLFQLALIGFLALRRMYKMVLVGAIVTFVSILLYLVFSIRKKKYLKKRQANLANISISRAPSQRGSLFVEQLVGLYRHPYIRKYNMEDYGKGFNQRESINLEV